MKASEGSPREYSTRLGSPASLLEPDAATSIDSRDDVRAAAHSPTAPNQRSHIQKGVQLMTSDESTLICTKLIVT